MKRISASLAVFLFASILIVGVGCGKKPNDAQISSDIQNKFSQDSGLSSKQLSVQANNGVVTLSGTVDNDSQRDAAARQAASEAGVKTVVNNLQVASHAASPVSASAAQPPAPKAQPALKPVKQEKPAPSKKWHKKYSDTSYSAVPAADSSTDDNSQSATPPTEQPVAAASVPSTPPPPPPPQKLTIEQGTQISVRLVDPIDSEKNTAGQTFHATLNSPLTAEGQEVLPAGIDVVGHIADLKSAGKFAGQSVVVLQLDSIAANGRTYNLQTDQYRKEGSSRGKNTAEKVGGGAAIGAIIGAIAGGGKGAAIGAAAGGGVGGGVQAATKGQQIKLPSETVLNFTLQAPITVIKEPNPDANRQKLSGS